MCLKLKNHSHPITRSTSVCGFLSYKNPCAFSCPPHPPPQHHYHPPCVKETVSEGACGARLMHTAGVAVSAENGPTPLPNDTTSILQRKVCASVCVCVHQAAILGATTQHLTPPLITLYLALSMCVSICVCVWERMKGPRRPLILNIDTLVSELHPVIPYAPLRDERWEGRMHGRWRKVRSEVRRGGRGGQEVRWAPRGDEGWGSRKESRWKRSTQSYNLREFLHW